MRWREVRAVLASAGLVALLSCLGGADPSTEPLVHPASQRGGTFDLAAATPLRTVRHGDPRLLSALEGGAARPVSLLAVDLDGDGVPELIGGYALPDGTGALVVHHGSKEATAPHSPVAREALAEGRSVPAFEPDAAVIAVPVTPDFLAEAPPSEGQRALWLAARGGAQIFALEATSSRSGDEAALQPLAQLTGALTAFVPVQGPRGEARLAVGLHGKDGAAIQLLERQGEALVPVFDAPLPSDATLIAAGELDGEAPQDVAVLTGGKVSVLRGGARLEALPLPFTVRALALGAFVPNRDPRAQLALVDADGDVHLAAHGDFEGASPDVRRDPRLRGRPPASAAKAEGFDHWRVLETFERVTGAGGRPPLLLRTRISDHGGDDLAIYDLDRNALSVLSHRERATKGQAFAPGQLSTREEPAAPVAVVPVRLGVDPRPGVALLSANGVQVAPTAGNPTLVVNSTTDATSTTLINNCLTGSGQCTLRAAVIAANQQAGADSIQLPAGTYTLTLAGTDEDGALTGDLDITDALTLNGAGSANTIIQAGTNATNGIDKVLSINPGLDKAFATVINDVTLRYGFNHSTVDSGGGWGGAFDWDSDGTGTLTLNDCVVSDNQTTDGDGGGIFASSNGGVGGRVTLNNVTFSNNTVKKGTAGESGIGGGLAIGAQLQLQITGGSFANNQAPQPQGEGGAIYLFESSGAAQSSIVHTTFSGNKATFSGGAVRSGRGLDISQSDFEGNQVSSGKGGALSLSALTETSHLSYSTIVNGSASVSGGGLSVTNGGPLDIHFCRIALNTAPTGAALDFSGSGALTASENWWACNTDPSGAACGKLSGVSTASVTPFLLVTASASPTSVQLGDSVTLTGSMVKDSAGTSQNLSNLTTLIGLPVSFQNPQKAQISSADTALSTSASAQATVQAQAAGAASVDLVVDGATATAGFTVVGPDLTITKTDPGTFTEGDASATYTIQVTNSGAGRTDSALPGGHPVVVTDTLPSDLTFVSAHGTGWSCSGTTTVSCSWNTTLEAGQAAAPLLIEVSVSPTAPTPVSNTATVSGGGEEASKTGNNSATDATPIRQLPDLTLTKTHVGNFRQGQVGAQYTIVVHNSRFGATDGSTVTVHDLLPAGLTATAFSGSGWTCTLSPLTCTSTAVVAGGATFPPITLTVDVAANASSPISNHAEVSGGGEIITDDNGVSDITVVDPAADLTLQKSHVGSFRQGQTGATYTLLVHNAGAGATLGATQVTDTLPAGLTATAFSGSGWTCTLSPLACTSNAVVAAGADFPALTLTVDVAQNAAPSLTNTASVSGGGELDTTNDGASDVTTVEQVADLTVTKSHAGDFQQGDTGKTYALTVQNTGPGPTVGTVTLSDTLPAGLTATAIAGTGWTCTVTPLQCTRSDALAAGSAYPQVTVTVDVAVNAQSSVINTATVSGGGELNTANDGASDPTTVIQVADLTVAKSHTGTFRQGDTGKTYSIVVTNAGSGPTVGQVTLEDALPAGLTATALAGTGWACTLSPLQCTRTDALAAGASYPSVTLTVDVAANAPASVTNTATVSGGGEVVTGNDTASDPTALTPVADLTITKSHPGNFTQGQVGALYTLVVTNSGPGDTVGTATVTDALPTGLTATAISGPGWTCTLATLTCTRSDVLTSGAAYPSITLTVTVADDAPASVTNTATISGGGELITTNDTASDPTTVFQLADLTLTKTHSGSFSQSQTGATYTLTVHNAGAGATDGTPLTVVDTLPPGLTATALSGTGWSCNLGTLTCTRSDVLAAGADAPTLTLTVDVASNAPASVTNTATVSGGGELLTGNDGASDPTSITQVADLTVTKSHSGNFWQGQTGSSYTLTVSNPGAGATSGTVSLVDTLPTGLTATALGGTGWTCDVPTVTCTRTDALASGASYPPVTLEVTVASNAPASVTNTATVSGGGEVVTTNDTASDPTTVLPGPDLALTKTHVGNFTEGQTGAQYTLTITNLGGVATTGAISVQDTLPVGLTATAISGTGWTCTLTPLGCTLSAPLAGGTAASPITVTVDVSTTAPGQVTNTAAVSGGGDINPTNDTASDPTVINLIADLTLTKSHTAAFAQGDTGLTYELVVHNTGGGASSGTVTVVDALPAGLTATALGGTGWACDLAARTCTRADPLAPGGDFAPIILTVDVAANAPAQVTNTATVSGGGEVVTGNDTAADPTAITSRADLTLTKSHTGDLRQGQVGGSYTLVVHNIGVGPTMGQVSVVDTLPSGLTATALAGPGWTCDVPSLTCSRSDALAAGASYPAITLTVDVAQDAPASLTNTATVSGGAELDPTNDTASDVANVIAVADLTLTKTHAGSLVQGQTGVAYTLTVTNSGVGDTTGEVRVTDAIPTGLALTGLTGTGWSCDLGTATCSRTDVLAAGSSYPPITVTVDVSSAAPTSLTNVATVSGGGELDTSNDSASDPATVAVLPDLTLASKHLDPFYAGQIGATYNLTVTNAGGGPTLAEVTVVDTLPAGLTATAMAGAGWTCTLTTLTCTRVDALAAGASYPDILLTVDVAGGTPPAINTATVSGGGEQNLANDTASDPTDIQAAPAHGCGCDQTGGGADLALGALAFLAFCFRPRRKLRDLLKGEGR